MGLRWWSEIDKNGKEQWRVGMAWGLLFTVGMIL